MATQNSMKELFNLRSNLSTQADRSDPVACLKKLCPQLVQVNGISECTYKGVRIVHDANKSTLTAYPFEGLAIHVSSEASDLVPELLQRLKQITFAYAYSGPIPIKMADNLVRSSRIAKQINSYSKNPL